MTDPRNRGRKAPASKQTSTGQRASKSSPKTGAPVRRVTPKPGQPGNTPVARPNEQRTPSPTSGSTARAHQPRQTVGVARQVRALTPEQRRAQLERERARKERDQRRRARPLGFTDPSKRMKFMSVSVLLLFAFFGLRLAHIQLIQGEALAAKALSLRTTEVTLAAARGEIVDRNGHLVAKSTTRYNIFADQELLADWKTVDKDKNEKGGPRYAAKLLAPVIGIAESELVGMLTKPADQEKFNKYQMLVKDVPPEMWNAVKDLKIVGIFPETFNKRIYPAGNSGANIIGIAGKDGGLSGLEYSLDETLTGTDGTLKFEQGGKGQIIPAGQIEEVPAVSGQTVNITMDMDIQWHAEEALRKQLDAMGATSGYVIVQDVKTCEVLALVSEEPESNDQNIQYTGRVGAVQDIFEPGSTSKIITMAAALETTDLTPTSQFTVADRYTTSNGQTFKDSVDHPVQQLTMAGILSESSNTGTVQVGEQLPKQVRSDYLRKFGFGTKTGIELGGESNGLLQAPEDWDGRTQYAVLFGQGMAGNALQTTNVFATVANGGKQCVPHLVAETVDDEGNVTPSKMSETTQIIQEQTANDVLKMMASVVVEGSGQSGAIAGYNVAGKTGTAQAADASGAMNSIVSSFIGVAPVEDPELVVSVIIRDPKAAIYGGVVAAPVFSDVMSYSLQRLGIAPTDQVPDLFPTRWGKDLQN